MAIALIKEKKPIIETEIEEVSVQSYWLYLRDLRLDASFYAEEGQKAIRLLQEKEFEILTLGSKQLSKKIFNPPPIKRHYSGPAGTPYFSPTELFLLKFKPSKYVHADQMDKIENWFVKDGWIIITQSGRVGIPLYVTHSLEEFIISQNAIRIIPAKDVFSGYLYAYLSTWMGQALLAKDQFGVTVEHIRPHHVSNIPIPNINKELQAQIHLNIKKAYRFRDEARELLKFAEDKMLTELNIPPYTATTRENTAFISATNKLNLRFDALYHDPIIEELINNFKNAGNEIVTLGDIADAYIPPRFKRVYVDKEHGVPFIHGTDTYLIKPRLLKYLSKKVTKYLNKWIISKNWVLMTCSGTVGRGFGSVSLVPEEWDRWALTQHVARIIPKSSQIHEGYLCAFLSSDYGLKQIISKRHGGFVSELSEDDIEDIVIPLPSHNIQKKIGELVVNAYKLRELANKIEDETIHIFELFLSDYSNDITFSRDIESYIETFELLGDEELIDALRDVNKDDFVPFNDL